MRILVTNDDGIHAPGLTVLEEIANPSDGRSRLLRLPSEAERRMRRWLDFSIKSYRQLD